MRLALAGGEPFVYAYYDGIDKVAHEYGLTGHYDAELKATDRLVADLLGVLPPGAALVVTSDHGQVQVGEAIVGIHDDVMAQVELLSRARGGSGGCTPARAGGSTSPSSPGSATATGPGCAPVRR